MANDNADFDTPDVQAERVEAFFARHAIPAPLFAQAVDRAMAFAAGVAEDGGAAPVAHWQPYGARNIGGRVRAVAQHPDNPLVIYAGTAAGGVFKSNDGGDTWSPIGGPQAMFSVGALAIAPSDPSVVYIGTGEPVVRHGVSGAFLVAQTGYPSGRGMFRLHEGTPLGVAEVGPAATNPGIPGAADSCARIAVDPNDADRCWFATHTGLWRRELVAGVPTYVREPLPPGGTPAAPAQGAAVTDVVAISGYDAARPRLVRVYAALGSVGIFRGTLDASAPHPGAAYPSVVWDPMLSNNLPAVSSAAAPTWDRIRLAVCRSQPNHVYATAEAAIGSTVLGIWHSADSGDHWTPQGVPNSVDGGSLTSSGWYSLYIEVHPENPAIIVVGEMNVVRSLDFGARWDLILDWLNYDRGDHAQHADQHAALFDSGDTRSLWVANDGGISLATDVVQPGSNPLSDRLWRKRSHGIFAAMFNDIAVNPTYPGQIGGGLQDNGTYVSFGGETWYSVFGGDGGQMSFEVGNPRSFISPWQGAVPASPPNPPGLPKQFALIRSTVTAATSTRTGGVRAPVNADQAPPNDLFTTAAIVRETGITLAAHQPPFVPVVEHHPVAASLMLIGRLNGGAYFSADFGANHTQLIFTPTATIGAAAVSALAFGTGPGVGADFWIGSDQGKVLLGTGATAVKAFSDVSPPTAAGATITRIAVHPADDRYVAVCTATPAGTLQGRVYVSADKGANWKDVSGLTPLGATQANSLPPGPCTSLAFDPQPITAALQVLFVGTLVGVFVIRNLPQRSPPAGAPLGAVVEVWSRFSGVPSGAPAGAAAMPMILVEDIQIVSLLARADAGVVVNAAETVARTRLYAASFGRGIYACDLTAVQPVGVPAGGPPTRVYIRQSVIEDGLSYPRQAPTKLNLAVGATRPDQFAGDPRFPLNAVPFTDREAFDIRIDNAPFQFFDDVIDGVEFDENLRTKAVAAGERNVVYVQVHSCGWQALPPSGATVHLYFAPGAAPAADPNADPVPDLHADFWTHWADATLPAPALAPVDPAAGWQRVGVPVTLTAVGPNQPAVARFEWLAPAMAATHVALLALVTTAVGVDPLVPAGQPTAMKTLLRNERRVAFRLAPVMRFVPDLFIRDGLDDTGRLGGVAFGGRSPDILVVPAALADLPGATADVVNPRSADRVAAGDSFVYVRVQNRKGVDTPVDVELFWAQANPAFSAAVDPAGPLTDNTHWQVVPPLVAAGNVNVTVPANGAVLVGFKFSARPAPTAGVVNALAFIALLKSHDGADPEPLRTRVSDAASFMRFFLQLADSNNAALRAVRYAP